MMTFARLTCFWPGLPRLWFRGDWGGLAVALGFAALVNFLLATTLVWPELVPPGVRAVAICVAPLWWFLAAGISWRQWPEFAGGTVGDGQQGLFVQAQKEYLRGNWLEAESCLRRLLRRSPRDIEALLLMASLARRTQRIGEARAQLQALSRLESAGRWQLEIRAERELLRRAAEEQRLAEIHSAPSRSSQADVPTEENDPPAADEPIDDDAPENSQSAARSHQYRHSQRRAA